MKKRKEQGNAKRKRMKINIYHQEENETIQRGGRYIFLRCKNMCPGNRLWKNNRKGDNKSLVGHNSLAKKADISSSTHVNIG